jgi:predicted nucleotidyltransferase
MEALPDLVASRLSEVRALCEKYRVKRLTLFGSAVKGTFDAERSDLDFVVEFFGDADPIRLGRAYWDLWRDLKRLFARGIDLVEVTTIVNPHFAASIDRDRVDLYDAA